MDATGSPTCAISSTSAKIQCIKHLGIPAQGSGGLAGITGVGRGAQEIRYCT